MNFIIIQALRFTAALLVLSFHLNIYDSGFKGVDLFFVISGFVICYSNNHSSADITAFSKARFVINRVSKIFLLYWTSLLALYVVSPYQLNASAANAFFLLPGHHSILGVSWSLSYEVYFYCISFVCFYILEPKAADYFFCAAFAISFIFTVAQFAGFSVKGHWVNFVAGQHLWEFLLGVFAARFFLGEIKVNRMLAATFLFIALGLLLFTSLSYNSKAVYLVYGSLSFVIVLCAVMAERNDTFHPSLASFINFLGEASYALYLFSPILLIVLQQYHLNNVVIIILVVVASCFIHLVYERPVLKYTRKIILSLFK